MKRGLALTGGGAKGAFQQGVLEVLDAHQLLSHFDLISGVSIGALHAFTVASNQLAGSRDVWETLDKNEAFETDISMIERVKTQNFDFLNHGLLPTKKLESLLDDMLDPQRLNTQEIYIGATRMGPEDASFGAIVAYNIKALTRGHLPIEYIPLHTVPKAVMKKILMASTAIPVFFKPIKMGNGLYIDGGVYNNTPLKPLLDRDCTHILVIDLFKHNVFRKAVIKKTQLMHIYPEEYMGRVLDFDPVKSRERMAYGKALATEHIEEIKHFILG